MPVRISDLRIREVVNVIDGKRLGFIIDLEVELETGRITAIVVPGSRWLGIFGREAEWVIPWTRIRKIGTDVILVEMAPYTHPGAD